MRPMRLLIVFFLGVFALTGCAHSGSLKASLKRIDKEAPDQTDYFDPESAELVEGMEQKVTGSLWVDAYGSHLYDNMYRAHRIGDTVMIVVSEESQGKNTGDTKSDKKSEHTASIDNLGNLMSKLSGMITGLDPTSLIKGKTDSKFQGKASTERTNSLMAKLAVTVTRVLKNGNMLVRGEKHVKVNKEDQFLIVEGIIRPYDILPDNTVLSSSLADARITYSGFGIVAERQKPGWLVRALDYVWPF